MARLSGGQLSHHREKGFRVGVGVYRGSGNRLRPRTFWLGHDLVTAQYAANQYRGAWSGIQLTGGNEWTSERVEDVQSAIKVFAEMRRAIHFKHEQDKKKLETEGQLLLAMFGPVPGSSEQGKKRVAESKPQSPANLYSAIEKYLETLKGKRRSDSHKERADRILNVNLKAVRKDCPLSEIDYLWIDSLCDHFKGRPTSLKNENSISATTVSIILRYLRAFFIWIDDTGYGEWQGPRKLAKPFRCNVRDLMTPAELRQSGTIAQFDHKTLKKLYSAASDFQKTLMLTALFTGATQQELSVLEKNEFDLDVGTLTHFRNKTKIEGRFWLPPELIGLLREDFAQRPKDPLAFRTADGNALVTFKDGRQTSDAVRQSWDDLRSAADLPDALSFKFLRKYLGDWMMRRGGEAIAQIALSHSRKTILAQNYTTARDFDTFNRLQRRMYEELIAVKVLVASETKAAA